MSNQKHDKKHIFDDGTYQGPIPAWGLIVIVVTLLVAAGFVS